MNTTKILTITIVLLVILGICTTVIAVVKPHMHKTIMLEQIIYKRAK